MILILRRISFILLLFSFFKSYGQQDTFRNFPDEVNKPKLAALIATETAFYVGGMAYLQYSWYKDTERVPFHYYNDNGGYKQIDKFGHAFGAYVESYLGYHWLRRTGVSRKKALIYGGTLGFVLQAPIEVFDGLYEGWGFSWGDMVANASGSVLVIGQELLWNSQPIKYKFSFHQSPYAAQANGYLGDNYLESLLYDYNGHTYWLSTGITNFAFKDKLPSWLAVAVGYSANGMFGEFENKRSYRGVAIPQTERYRQFLLSLDVDWTRIRTKSRFLNGLCKALFFIKLPFPTLEINTKGQLKGHWLYY